MEKYGRLKFQRFYVQLKKVRDCEAPLRGTIARRDCEAGLDPSGKRMWAGNHEGEPAAIQKLMQKGVDQCGLKW